MDNEVERGGAVLRLEPPASKFVEFLRAIGDGMFEAQLSDAVVEMSNEMVQAGQNGGKATGTFELKIKVKIDRGLFTIEPVLNMKLPKPVAPMTVLYPSIHGGFSRNNPKAQEQLEMYRDGAPPAAPLRDLNAGLR